MRRGAVYPPRSFRDPKDTRLVQIIKRAAAPREEAVNILGVPYDGAVLGRRGAAEGPTAIRGAIGGFSNFNIELGLGLSGAPLFDIGDLMLPKRNVSDVQTAIEKEVRDDLNETSLLVLLGGDNSISLPALVALSETFGDIGLVVVDSHLDLRGRINGMPTSGSSYGLALERAKGLDPKRIVEIGVHGFLNSEAYARKAEELGITLLTASETRRSGAIKVAREALSIASKGSTAVYLSVDLDAIDLSEMSGVSAPSAGGLNSAEVQELAFALAKSRLVKCADIVELAPNLDATGSSARVAASVLVSIMAGFVSRKK